MAAGDKITNQRIRSIFEICLNLDMNDSNNQLLRTIKKQPDGIYPEANMMEMKYWLKWELGRDNEEKKWWPMVVYESILANIENFAYGKAAVIDLMKPPENAVAGVGEITCDADAYGDPARTPLSFKWNATNLVWTEQAAGTFTTVWTFTEAAGDYVLAWDDYATTGSFCTAKLTVT